VFPFTESLFISLDVFPCFHVYLDTPEARRGAGRAAEPAARWQSRHRGAIPAVPQLHRPASGSGRGLRAGRGGRPGAAAAHEAHPGAAPDCQRTAHLRQGRQGELWQHGEYPAPARISSDFPQELQGEIAAGVVEQSAPTPYINPM